MKLIDEKQLQSTQNLGVTKNRGLLKDYGLRPEVSSPPCLRIQEGSFEHNGEAAAEKEQQQDNNYPFYFRGIVIIYYYCVLKTTILQTNTKQEMEKFNQLCTYICNEPHFRQQTFLF